MEACPSRSCTNLGFTPDARSKEACECLRSCTLISGRPALFKACLKWRIKFLGEIGPPVLIVKMSPWLSFRQVTGSNPIGDSPKISDFSPVNRLCRKEKPLCYRAKSMSRRFLKFLKGIVSAQQPIHFWLTAKQESFPDTHPGSTESSCDATFWRLEKNIIQGVSTVPIGLRARFSSG
jgi:hypothetical protein